MNEQTKELYDTLADLGLPVQEVDDTRHYWFIRTQGGSYFDEFFLDNFVAIGHEDVPCVPEDKRTDQLIDRLKEAHPQTTRVLNQVYRFCKEIHKGDIVIIPSAASAHFAFGYITDDEAYQEELNEEDLAEGKCPYTRRRKTHWIQGISKDRVDSKLYTFFRNQQALSQVDTYSDFIERAIHPLYIKNDTAHFTLSIRTPDSPNAFDIPTYMCGILTMAQELAEELKISTTDFSTNIKSRTNVQSAGLIELLGDPAFVALISVVAVALFGGTVKFNFSNDRKTGEMKTDGLIGAITKIMDRRNKSKKYTEEEMQAIIERLKIENPTNTKREDDL